MLIIKDINKIIKKKTKMAREEIDLAMKYKMDYPEASKSLYEMSKDEINDIESNLHANVEKLIMAYRQKNGEPTEGMKAVYDWLHQEMIEDVTEIKNMQTMYMK